MKKMLLALCLLGVVLSMLVPAGNAQSCFRAPTNFVFNGYFDQGLNYWSFQNTMGAAQFDSNNNMMNVRFHADVHGTVTALQFFGVLVPDYEYGVSFEAWADIPDTIIVKVESLLGMNGLPFTISIPLTQIPTGYGIGIGQRLSFTDGGLVFHFEQCKTTIHIDSVVFDVIGPWNTPVHQTTWGGIKALYRR